MSAAAWPPAGHYPQPLYIAHLVPGAFLAACGRFPASRRFDPDRGTFCQDTGRHTLNPQQTEGYEACPDCLATQKATTGRNPA